MSVASVGEERRSHARWRGEDPQPVPVRTAAGTQFGKIRDVSAGGIVLTGNFEAAVGTQVQVEINDALRLPGVVQRSTGETVTIRFVLTKALCKQIDDAIGLGLAPSEW